MSMEVQKYIRNESIQKRIEELLKNRASQFTTSLISVINSNTLLAECKPETVLNAALTAAALDLPINQNLGFAYIIPYKNRGVYEAQFQMGWKGFVQLAQRSGRYKTISATPVYAGQLISTDPLKGFVWDWSKPADGEPVGYAAYFELLNGFEKTLYMTKDEIETHAGRYSQAYKSRGNSSFKSPWETDFDLMAQKTVIKLLISRFGPLSTAMEKALESDQAVITDATPVYVDNSELADVGADEEKKNEIIAAHKDETETKETKGDKNTPSQTGKPSVADTSGR